MEVGLVDVFCDCHGRMFVTALAYKCTFVFPPEQPTCGLFYDYLQSHHPQARSALCASPKFNGKLGLEWKDALASDATFLDDDVGVEQVTLVKHEWSSAPS